MSVSLIVSVDFPPHKDGVSTVSGEMAEKLTQMGENIIAVGPYEKGVREFDKNLPYKVYRTPFYNSGYLRFLPIALIMPYLLLKYRIITIFPMNIAYGGICSYFLSKIFKFKYVMFGYGYEFCKVEKNPVLKVLYLRIYKNAKVIFAISKFVKKRLMEFGVDEGKIDLNYPGTDPDKFYPLEISESDYKKFKISKDFKLILSVGRLVERKGHDMVIKAMPEVLKQIPETKYLIVGIGPMENKLKGIAKELNIEEKVKFLGKVPDKELLYLYNMCDVFIMPSREIKEEGQVEGYGIVYLEANACAKPVIAGNSGGIKDCVIDGYNGIIINSEKIDDITNALIKLLSDKELREELGRQGRERVEKEMNWRQFTKKVYRLTY